MRFQFGLRLLIGVALAFSACATPARQTELILKGPRDVPDVHEIADVPFIDQSEYYCGPSTLTMALLWAGKDVTVDQVAPQVFTPGKKGSFQTDMLVAARRNGMVAIPVQGMPALLREISAGHPVIIFENLALSWYPKWHYALVIGYDLPEKEIILHDGNRARRRWDMKKFERSWMLTEYWGFTVLPPGILAASADDLAHAAAGAALERDGRSADAEKVYRSILAKWPRSLGALIGMGNIEYARGKYRESVKYLRQATEYHPESSAARQNLKTASGKL